ncbi:hypothetical protein HanRHA438_Chr14g0681271 [Helianthus annuus]|nr:hypothetical protein HanRHA438_Chr14g0681271 [Helianthus annuus]
MWFECSLICCFAKIALDICLYLSCYEIYMLRIFVLNVVKLSFVCSLYVCLSLILFVWLVELCGSCLTISVVKICFICDSLVCYLK